MARLTPDPTFYTSPATAAAEAPAETVAYVVTLNERGNEATRPDALTVLDLQAGSDTCELCVLVALRDALRQREVYVEGASAPKRIFGSILRPRLHPEMRSFVDVTAATAQTMHASTGSFSARECARRCVWGTGLAAS